MAPGEHLLPIPRAASSREGRGFFLLETAMPPQRFTPPSEEQFSQLIKTNAPVNPNFQVIQRTVIKAGPRHYKAATVFNIKDPQTGNIVRRSLQVNSFLFKVGGGIDFGEKNR